MGWGREKNREEKQNEESGESKESEVESKSSKFFENRVEIRWLTTKEAAQFLRISTKSLLNLTSNGRVRYYKFGRSNRFLLSELHLLLLGKPRGGSYGT